MPRAEDSAVQPVTSPADLAREGPAMRILIVVPCRVQAHRPVRIATETPQRNLAELRRGRISCSQ
jgi:hypothetical protein